MTDREERRKRGIVALIPSGRFDQTGVPDDNVIVEVVPSANNRVDVEEPVLAPFGDQAEERSPSL